MNGIGQADRAEQCRIWGVLPGPSPSLIFSPIDDGLDVTLTSAISWFHPNLDMVSHRVYKISIYGRLSITLAHPAQP